ncbi:Por secretion system C-terminal sorting domain [Chryseobacterium nakagawai]|uniref:T9SS C-terminal target domain-containing protein n=1 Tax=Chryseobacterium nakagawai TaxID=1241982 RepID=A0AAD1DSX5_CHRNA|nr:T9SS type A sorting domain-containing protein [Chryseobacterium nakagawai]AZA93261.1 T9SS C-terminal target domain-containing protein [Chryseobacterium nakagawai]VEH19923.1 Por secretion system C-terminal sorting domain [Chryseobacterium nakagawai]
MKLKLLLGALILTAFTAKAQVPTINENFDNFTAGNTTFPQFGWSTVVAPLVMNEAPFPVPPRMIVTNTSANRAVQSYSGTNPTNPSYLISPQIQAPAGDKTLKFTTTLVSPSPGPGTIQIGLASNPTDMSTFTPVGNPITVSAIGTILNINVPIPASTSSYLVFKFTPSAMHVAVQIDDVVYDTTGSLGVNDNAVAQNEVKFFVNADNTSLGFVAKKDPKNIQIYSSAGLKVAEGKLNGQKFNINGLQTGVYFIAIETAEGKIIQSKFIKK